jgi:protein-S-isoprenylcysteine O-methyltransferase Ste14
MSATTHPLENRFPPPIVCLLAGLAMGALAWATPAIAVDPFLRIGIAVPVALVGLFVGASGFLAFGRAKTTIDPVHIDRASTLVTGGIFRFTRNPMYVGFTLLLLGWAVYLAAPWAFLGPVAFVLFTTRYQILPEERIMLSKFGAAYADYQTRVRRWI